MRIVQKSSPKPTDLGLLLQVSGIFIGNLKKTFDISDFLW